MNLGLEQIGQTLAVGAFALYGAFILVRMNPWLYETLKFLNSQIKSEGRPGIAEGAAYIALVITFGVLAEGISYNYASNREPNLGTALSRLYDYFIVDDKGFRIHSLIRHQVDFESTEIHGMTTELLVSIIDKEFISKFGGRSGLRAENALRNAHPEPESWITIHNEEAARDIMDSLNALYYHAKNTVYRNPNHYNELSRLESRITFIRAFSFVCVSILTLSVISTLGGVTHFAFLAIRKKPFHRWDNIIVHACFITAMTSLCFFGKWSQGSERINFNLRVYGYFEALPMGQKYLEQSDRDPVDKEPTDSA